ncbi:ketopantoate reductase PanE/ApbA-domain-containing protein [Apiosordaria backusii]|uniref:Ketopantoate reductase PanE/ApbA-domain-containing protein n=1 Tax=Apiosordaria backusii TaxID=314023 RepID=A0AA40DJZ1_9PEZI|nr:ketopantoate reductase PanE/ApbA-domain-containing protein [Apiosordaria backusii]
MGGLYRAPKAGSDPVRPVNIVFVGAGAVGCFYASRLHHPDHNIHVSLIARSNYRALEESGVKLQTHTFGNYTFRPSAVYPSPDAASKAVKQWDYIIVTTKALPDVSDDSALIAPLVSPDSCIVLIQNGVGVEEPYRLRFPTNPIVSGVTVISAEQTSPGVIRQNRWTRLHLGPYSDSANSSSDRDTGDGTTGALVPSSSSSPSSPAAATITPDDDSFNEALLTAGTACSDALGDWWTRLGQIPDITVSSEIDLQLIRWHKLTINAAFNPSSVLSGGLGNAEMVRDPELRRHLHGVMKEIWDAAPKILGRGFPPELAGPEKILRSTERNVGSKPSMLLDWEGGRRMELEVILGNPVRLARRRGVELGRMGTLYALLRSAQEVRDGGKKARL